MDEFFKAFVISMLFYRNVHVRIRRARFPALELLVKPFFLW